jgi:N4-gp56 family major capsid protein
MAAPTDATTLSNLVNPEVLAPIISYQLQKALRFTPLAQIDRTLSGRPGDTLKFPAYGYIGDAADVAEGEAIPYEKLATTMKSVQVKKAGIGVKITDEAALSGYGDPVGEAQSQIAKSLANKVDNDLLAAARTAAQTSSMTTTGVAGLDTAVDIFDDEDAMAYVLICSPAAASKLRADANAKKIGSDVGANALISGTYADINGVQIVRSKKVNVDEGILVKVSNPANDMTPAFKLVMKRDVQVESGRDMDLKLTKVNADEHYAPFLYNDAKVVKVTFGDLTPEA